MKLNSKCFSANCVWELSFGVAVEKIRNNKLVAMNCDSILLFLIENSQQRHAAALT